jgi:Mg2+ and Co2+ transporter CorA
MDRDFLQERIDATKAQIIAYEDAATALASGGVQSYTLDTGQSRQTVTRLDLRALQDKIDSLYNRLATLEARLNGSGTVTARPAW